MRSIKQFTQRMLTKLLGFRRNVLAGFLCGIIFGGFAGSHHAAHAQFKPDPTERSTASSVTLIASNSGVNAGTAANGTGVGNASAKTNATLPPATHQVLANQTILIARYSEVDRRVCRALAAPNVAITAQPTLGRVSLLKRDIPISVKGCGTLLVPHTEITYQAFSRPGADRLSWAVYYQALHRNGSNQATIQVELP